MYNDNLHDGSICIDYSKSDTNYEDCLITTLKEEFMSGYGCIPPWVTNVETESACVVEKNSGTLII
jgi:hypothetical protein